MFEKKEKKWLDFNNIKRQTLGWHWLQLQKKLVLVSNGFIQWEEFNLGVLSPREVLGFKLVFFLIVWRHKEIYVDFYVVL